MLRVGLEAGQTPGWEDAHVPQVELSTIQPFLSLPGLLGATLKSKGIRRKYSADTSRCFIGKFQKQKMAPLSSDWADYFLEVWVPFLWIENLATVVSRLQF